MNTIKQQIQDEIASYESKIKTLNAALAILEDKEAPIKVEKRKYTKRVKVKSEVKRKTKLPTIKWKKTLIPFLEQQQKPLNVNQITSGLFPKVRKKTKYLINSRLSATLLGLKKKGVVKSEGARGNRGNATMKYSLVNQ